MSTFQSISADTFDFSPFYMIGKDWLAITAEKDGKANAMTASWGSLGVMWGKNAAFIVVRDSRYTKECLDTSDYFSLAVFKGEEYRKTLGYLGSASGRNEDKIVSAGLTIAHQDNIPYIEEADCVFLCRKMCCQPITPESFVDPEIKDRWYQDEDWHNLYIGEIVGILKKSSEIQ